MIASNLTEVRKYNDRERREWFMIRLIQKTDFPFFPRFTNIRQYVHLTFNSI